MLARLEVRVGEQEENFAQLCTLEEVREKLHRVRADHADVLVSAAHTAGVAHELLILALLVSIKRLRRVDGRVCVRRTWRSGARRVLRAAAVVVFRRVLVRGTSIRGMLLRLLMRET